MPQFMHLASIATFIKFVFIIPCRNVFLCFVACLLNLSLVSALLAVSPASSDTLYWSNSADWNGFEPANGDNVTIPHHHIVVLDQDTPALGGLTINGTLIFARQDLTLTANWIMVHGELRVGTEQSPFTHRAVIQVQGTDVSLSVMGMGNRGIMVMDGRLELHGNPPQVTQTVLDAHAPSGVMQFTLAAQSGWQIGDEIIIGPTDYYGVSATQRFTLSAINGVTVSTEEQNNSFRWGTLQYATVNGMSEQATSIVVPPLADVDTASTPLVLDERAPVGHLTRNIRIEAPDDTVWQQEGFGVHIMVMGHHSQARINGVEIRRGGQAGILGRYPIHWHELSYNNNLTLNDVQNQYIRNSVIHESAQRGIVIHGTNGLLVENNIVYHVRGHGIFLEDAVERRNTFSGNMVAHVRNPAFGNVLKQHEIGEFGSSGFWLTNPDNYLINNRVLDAQGHGFWLAFPNQPFGSHAGVLHTDGQILRPNRLLFGTFDQNTAHSNGFDGIHIDNVEINNAGNTMAEQYRSTTNGREIEWPVTTLRRFPLSRFSVWKNMRRGIWDRAVWPDNYGGVSADNNGRFFAGSGADGLISRNLVVGTSLNFNTNGVGRPQRLETFTGDMNLATPTAFATYHSTFDIQHNIIVNFPHVPHTRSGAFATEDYYIRAVDKGHARNVGNLLVNSHYGLKISPLFNYYNLAGALWDPYNAWGGEGEHNYFVYDAPFYTYGQATVPVQPAGTTGGVLTEGPYYGINKFVVNNANFFEMDLMEMVVTRLNEELEPVGVLHLAEAQSDWFLQHMRHAALHPSGIYTLEFPGYEEVQDVHFEIENMLHEADSLILAIHYSGSWQVDQVYTSTFGVGGHARNNGVAQYNEPWDLKRIFVQKNTLQDVLDAPELGAYWHDVNNNRVWTKIRGGMVTEIEANNQTHLYGPYTDEILYQAMDLRIYGSPKRSHTLVGDEGWFLLSNPFQTETLAQFLAPIWTQGGAGSDAPLAEPNVWILQDDELTHGGQFRPWTDFHSPMGNGRGYAVYVFANDDVTQTETQHGFPKTLYSLGTLPEFPLQLPVFYSEHENEQDRGWNLIGNPDTVMVSWPEDFSLVNVHQTAYFWNNALGQWEFTDGAYLNPQLKEIPPFTSFVIQASGVQPELSYPAQVQKNSANVGIHTAWDAELRFSLQSGNFRQSVLFHFHPDEYASGLDERDVYALTPMSAQPFHIATEQQGYQFSRLAEPLPSANTTTVYAIYLNNSDALPATLRLHHTLASHHLMVEVHDLLTNETYLVADSVAVEIEMPTQAKKAEVQPPSVMHAIQPQVAQSGDRRFVLTVRANELGTSIDEPTSTFRFQLHPNYPNPFNPTTTLRFELKHQTEVKLEIYTVLGQKVKTLVQSTYAQGVHDVQFDARALPSGVYFAKLYTPEYTSIQKMLLVK